VEYFDFLPTLTSVRELPLSLDFETTPPALLGYLARVTWLESLTLHVDAPVTSEFNLRFLRGFSQLRTLQLSCFGVLEGVYLDFLPQLTRLRDSCWSRCGISVQFLHY
jgi:hypothetical protein